jgi:hypothetical protein
MTTNVICSKCGKVAEHDQAKREGWLISRRAGAPEGYLVIRCPEHVTEHARRQAGLSQRIHTGKIARRIGAGLEVEYRQGYKAIAGETEDGYCISYFETSELMPAFKTEHFTTIEALAAQMATLSDLRKWRVVRAEE